MKNIKMLTMILDIIAQLLSTIRGATHLKIAGSSGIHPHSQGLSLLHHKHLISICCATLLFAGCSGTTKPEPTGAKISQEQAEKVSLEKYQMSKVNKVELRQLSDQEMKLVPEDAKNKTPIYYIVSGVNESGKQVTVYVSSNDESHYYSNE
ncbi:hypothetical protein EEL31_04720 [Brevibacillus laterosporus]|nr:hypothetical protein [Brevibacillus laterosporus]TPG67935.1 hypothetical protein EEL31_04720 [Brevibacillus laterosporus]